MRVGIVSLRGVPLAVALAALLPVSPAVAASGQCRGPTTPQMGAALPLEQAYRTRTMGLEAPSDLFRSALRQPGKVFVRRDGKRGQAVLAAPVPVEDFWRAINDDAHHDDESGYIPLRLSRVIEGPPASSGRRTFQYFKKAGLGRWWVNELTMSPDLFRASDGLMWELTWTDVMVDYPGESPPIDIDDDVRPLHSGLGAWVLYPLGEDCVLVEYATEGDPGGLLGAFQFVVATRAVRKTLTGMLEMAQSHMVEDHGAVRFVRPDGESIDD